MPFIDVEQVLYDEELKPEKTVYHRIRSVSKIEHVDFVVRDWRRSIGEQSHNADDLLLRWQVAFPHLDYCNEYSLMLRSPQQISVSFPYGKNKIRVIHGLPDM